MYNGDGVLDHKSRKLIYNYISTHPGAPFGVIKKVFDMNTSTLKYHLHYLEKSNKIFSKREGRRRCYYCTQRSELQISPYSGVDQYNITQVQQRILNIIKTEPGITDDELIIKTRLTRKNLDYNLKRLGELKLIWMVNTDGIVGYELITKEKLREEMLTRLVLRLISDEIDEDTFNRIKKKLEKMDIDELKI
jgi:predicted transcriptional regulator